MRKMSVKELPGRVIERIVTHASWLTFICLKRPYSHFAPDKSIVLLPLPGVRIPVDPKMYDVYRRTIDLMGPVDWYSAEGKSRNSSWPTSYYANIDYKPGNPWGDIRMNWELNRLQFLPAMAVLDEVRAQQLLQDWLEKTPYLQGPSYVSPMEVAIRWISIYWAICLMTKPLDRQLKRNIEGLCAASGRFIEKRLSTHSSAGNHLIVEAVGLFWLGKALESTKQGIAWLSKGRQILWDQALRQILPDGTGREQSFWYLGFVLDALFHYLLLEDRKLVPQEVLHRIENALDFVDAMILPDGSFFDYGDRDDGSIFRSDWRYEESPFPSLLSHGSLFFQKTQWYRDSPMAARRLKFWGYEPPRASTSSASVNTAETGLASKKVITYRDGGMTLMRQGDGRLLFRHAKLGLEPTYGHGHADALSVLLTWKKVPVLTDGGTGQYNGDSKVRDYFRSTIAHNTIEVEGVSQAKILGPFMWDQSYECALRAAAESPIPSVEAYHDAYQRRFGIVHVRRIDWPIPEKIEIWDRFLGKGRRVRCRGSFHIGKCNRIDQYGSRILITYDRFAVCIALPREFDVAAYRESINPFLGWRSTLYGSLEPSYSIVYSFIDTGEVGHKVRINILDGN